MSAMTVPTNFRKTSSCDAEIPAVARAIDLLEILVTSGRGLTLSEVSQKLGIVKSSSHRLINSLLSRGYLQRGLDGHHYMLGDRVLQFADAAVVESQLRTVCSPHAQKLGEESGLTVLASVIRGFEAISFLKVASSKDNFPGATLGHHSDVHCTACGKAIIAYASDTELEKLFREKSLTRYTPNTVGSLEALKVDLAEVRARGYAINNEELAIGGRAVAAPIFNHIGRVVASICVRGSVDILPESRIPIYGKEVVATADEISRDLWEFRPNTLQS